MFRILLTPRAARVKIKLAQIPTVHTCQSMVLTREQKSQLAYELAAEALDLRASARVEYLDRVCGADHSLRAEVDYLLALVEQPGIVDPTGSLNLSLPGLHPSELIDNR